MNADVSVIAGIISTTIFVMSTLPMLHKAARTKDLASYSLGNILLANTGNLVHSIYVFQLPFGPIWLLHSFYLITTAMMLFWYVRYEGLPRSLSRRSDAPLTGREVSSVSLSQRRSHFESAKWSSPVVNVVMPRGYATTATTWASHKATSALAVMHRRSGIRTSKSQSACRRLRARNV